MFWVILKKELKVFFSSKGNLIVMLLLPILLLVIFGSALEDYMNADYGTFEQGIVFYHDQNAGVEMLETFDNYTSLITEATGVGFTEIEDVEAGKKRVEESEAYGVITISETGFEYFRSTFNEPEDGVLVRNLFVQLANAHTNIADTKPQVERTVLSVPAVDSKGYYTFASLAFSILFMGLIIAFSVHREKTYRTIERIRLSKAGVKQVFCAKVITGVVCGAVQSIVVFSFSSIVFKVSWGSKIGLIFLLLLVLALYSAVFGAIIGLICKNKAICQSIVLMASMLCGYLGGSITPLTLLENTPVMKVIINISPLYWINQAVMKLRVGVVDSSLTYAVLVLLGLIAVIAFIGISATKKRVSKKVIAKEVA